MVDELRAENMITVAAGDNVVRLLPPLIINEEEIGEAVATASTAPARGWRRSPNRRRRRRHDRQRRAALPRPHRHPQADAGPSDRFQPRHEGGARARPEFQAARRQDAGDDLRQALDPHPRLLRRRHAPARRRVDHADRPGDAAWPRRDARRHRPRALALRRRHHDPHPRSRGGGRARASRAPSR